MKTRTLAFTLISMCSTAALAATPPSAGSAFGLDDVVAEMQSRYPGKVVAIELDDSGDRAAHYHVDMRFPDAGIARLDVDAATLGIASREAAPLASESAPLVYAAALVASQVTGNVLAAKLDATNGSPAHYDVDVILPQGAIARFKVDTTSGQIGWRSPAIVND